VAPDAVSAAPAEGSGAAVAHSVLPPLPAGDLASLLGGVVGVSRVVTSEGWRPHTQQVGQVRLG
jgi:electron transfer flavoprotein alpha subunit